MDILGFEKLIYHHDRIMAIRDGKPLFPVHATLSLGNYCNHACLWCSVFAHQQSAVKKASFDKLMDFLEPASQRGLRAVGYVGNGEPTAYPKFRQLTTRVAEIGLEQGMFTNGYLLDRYEDEVLENFTYIRISLDAGSREVHDAMHAVSGHYDKIIANLEQIVAKRRNGTPTIGIQYATHHRNLHDLPNAIRFAADLGVDYFSVKPVFNRGSVGERIEKNRLTFEELSPIVAEAQSRHERRDFAIHYRPFQILTEEADKTVLEYDRCVAGFFNVNIYEDDTVVYCGPHRIPVGNLDDDFETLEQNILSMSHKLDLSQCPGGCRYHPLNHIVHTVLHPPSRAQFHPNFL